MSDPEVPTLADAAGTSLAGQREPDTPAEARAGDGRCADCRRGHYSMPGGSVTNFPCVTEGCTCWFCGPVKTPAQARAMVAPATEVDHA